MAKEFGGFTPDQTMTLLRRLGYSGAADQDSMEQFIASNPAAAAKMGQYHVVAQRMINGQPAAKVMPPATQARAMAEGGSVVDTTGKTNDKEAAKAMVDGQQQMMLDSYTKPELLVQEPTVAKIETTDNQLIDSSAGQLQGTTPTASYTPVTAETTTAVAPKEAATFEAATSTQAVQDATSTMQSAQGTVSDQSQVTAQTTDPTQLAQLTMQAEQIAQAQQVQAPAARTLQAGEAVSGTAVDMQKVQDATNIVAAQAEPSKAATVQGQLEGLMQQFEGGNTPAWAAGAMRAATAALAQRGLAASSMAGQAIIQATMESALPIAMADAQTRAQFESQNLSNRQQAAMLGAEQRAKFLEMEFDQNFQARVLNAAKISDIANMNFTAEQQIALENARLAQSVDLANLDARSAKLMADMAAMSQMDMANLNNRQQAAVMNAQAFLQMDMTNLSNAQQMTMFKSQSLIQSLFNDSAAENTARQINAASVNQVNQFYDSLRTSVDQFNAAQVNAMSQFNADQETTVDKFNAEMENARQIFEAQNSLTIATANAQWFQNVATLDTAAENEANLQYALSVTDMTKTSLNNLYQRERDLMDYAFQSRENAADRAASIALAKLTAEQEKELAGDIAKGKFAAELIDSAFNW